MGAAFSSPEMTVRPRERGRHVYQRWQQTRQDGRGDLLSVGSRSKRMSATLSPPPPPSSAQAAGRAWHLRRRHHRRRHGDSEDGRGIFATGATGEDSETDRTWAARSPPSAAETTQDGCGTLVGIGSSSSMALSEASSPETTERPRRRVAALSPPSPPERTVRPERTWAARSPPSAADHARRVRRPPQCRQQKQEDERDTFAAAAVVSRSGKTSVALSQASPPETTGRPRRWARHFHHRRHRRGQ